MPLLKSKESIKSDINDLLKDINNKNAPERYCIFIFGLFLQAFSFNIFYAPYNIVTGGTTGLSILFKHLFNVDPSLFVLISSVILLILSFFLLDFKNTLRSVIGTLLLPLFIKTTAILVSYINFNNTSLFVIALFGGIISGLSTGLIMKTGFTSGGYNILYQIINKYFKISIGKSSLIINTITIAFAAVVFGVTNSLYAVLSLYISTMITDKVLLGTSKSKAFYIVTKKSDLVTEFITTNLNHSATIIKSKGGYTNENMDMLLCLVPTRQYYILKEVVTKIDKDAFFLITDTYETSGGR